MRHHRAQPADQRLEYRVEYQGACPRHEQVDREPPAPPDGQRERGQAMTVHSTPSLPSQVTALTMRPARRAPRQVVDPGGGAVVDGFERGPLQPYAREQQPEDKRRHGNDGSGVRRPRVRLRLTWVAGCPILGIHACFIQGRWGRAEKAGRIPCLWSGQD